MKWFGFLSLSFSLLSLSPLSTIRIWKINRFAVSNNLWWCKERWWCWETFLRVIFLGKYIKSECIQTRKITLIFYLFYYFLVRWYDLSTRTIEIKALKFITCALKIIKLSPTKLSTEIFFYDLVLLLKKFVKTKRDE